VVIIYCPSLISEILDSLDPNMAFVNLLANGRFIRFGVEQNQNMPEKWHNYEDPL